jgi:hypothetical protein
MMTFDTFKACLNKMPLDTVLHFAGMSECWINPECSKMILYTHQKGYQIRMLTTLVGMKLADIDLIERVPFVSFLIHLPSNEGYENINVDEDYLKVLDRISNSQIKTSYMIVAGTVHCKVKALLQSKIKSLEGKPLLLAKAMSLAGNVREKVKPTMKRLGVISCNNGLDLNSLLPNGDVVLCCMDFSMQHSLGNLLVSDFKSLFLKEEFSKIKAGLKDASLDTLCRYCEQTTNIDLFARIYNPAMLFIREMRDPSVAYYNIKRLFLKRLSAISRITWKAALK